MKKNYQTIIKKIDKIHRRRKHLNIIEDKLKKQLSSKN